MLVLHTLNLCFQVLESSVNPGMGCNYIRELLIFFSKRGSSVNDVNFVEEEFLESHSDQENLFPSSRLTMKKDILMKTCFPDNIFLVGLLIYFKYDLMFTFMIKIRILIILVNFCLQKYLS